MNKKEEIISLYPLSSSDKNNIISQYLTARVTPAMYACDSFAAMLTENGNVIIANNNCQYKLCSNVIKIAAGKDHIICLKNDGTVFAFGDNRFRQCEVSEWKNISDICAGAKYSSAVTYKNEILISGHMSEKNYTNFSFIDTEFLEQLEKQYSSNNYNGIKTVGNNFKIFEGSVPVLISASHSVKTVRNGTLKAADIYTGAITEYLCKTCNVNGIVRIFNQQQTGNDDPNYYNSGKSLLYKKAMLDIIKNKGIVCVIDIHGCSDEHGFEIEIGTNSGKYLNKKQDYSDLIIKELSCCGKTVADQVFKASSDCCICKYIHAHSGISCYQIEFAHSLRKNPENIMMKMINIIYLISHTFSS